MPRRRSSRHQRKQKQTRRLRHRRRKTSRRKLSGGVNSPRSDDLSFVFPAGDSDGLSIDQYLGSGIPTPAKSVGQKRSQTRKRDPLTAAQKKNKLKNQQFVRWMRRARTLRREKVADWRERMGHGSDSNVAPYDNPLVPWDDDDQGSLAVNLMEAQSYPQERMKDEWHANKVADRGLPAEWEQVPAHGTGIDNDNICGRVNPKGDGSICSRLPTHAGHCRFS